MGCGNGRLVRLPQRVRSVAGADTFRESGRGKILCVLTDFSLTLTAYLEQTRDLAPVCGPGARTTSFAENRAVNRQAACAKVTLRVR